MVIQDLRAFNVEIKDRYIRCTGVEIVGEILLTDKGYYTVEKRLDFYEAEIKLIPYTRSVNDKGIVEQGYVGKVYLHYGVIYKTDKTLRVVRLWPEESCDLSPVGDEMLGAKEQIFCGNYHHYVGDHVPGLFNTWVVKKKIDGLESYYYLCTVLVPRQRLGIRTLDPVTMTYEQDLGEIGDLIEVSGVTYRITKIGTLTKER